MTVNGGQVKARVDKIKYVFVHGKYSTVFLYCFLYIHFFLLLFLTVFLSSSEGLGNTHKLTNLKPKKESVLLTVSATFLKQFSRFTFLVDYNHFY